MVVKKHEIEFKNDLRLMRDILRLNRPMSLFQVSRAVIFPNEPLLVQSDASLSGWGALCGKLWISGLWPVEMSNWDIQILECLAVLFSLLAWRQLFVNHDSGVLFQVDNQSVMWALRTSSHKQSIVRKLVKVISLELANLEVIWKTDYISTKDNFWADWFSRFPPQRVLTIAEDHRMPFSELPTPFQYSTKLINLSEFVPEVLWSSIIKY